MHQVLRKHCDYSILTLQFLSVFRRRLQKQNKPLLIANEDFIPYLVDALLLDPEHPRADMKQELKAWCQEHHTEALAQLAVHGESREALRRDGSVAPALEAVSRSGLSQAARELAAAALSALSDKKLVRATDGQKHVMLSCEFGEADLALMLDCCFSCDGEVIG